MSVGRGGGSSVRLRGGMFGRGCVGGRGLLVGSGTVRQPGLGTSLVTTRGLVAARCARRRVGVGEGG